MPRKDNFGALSAKERADLGDRIRVLVEAAGTQAQAAEISEVTVQQLGRFMRAANAPSLMPLARLALVTGVSLDWVALGVGPRYREHIGEISRPALIDAQLLGRVIEAVADAHLQAANVLSPGELARISAREYEAIALTAASPADEHLLLRAMAARLRREISDAAEAADESGEEDRLSEVRRKG